MPGMPLPDPLFAPLPSWRYLGRLALLVALCLLGVWARASDAASAPRSAAQEAWIASHKDALRVAPEANYPPFSFMQDGVWQGLSADMTALMQQHMPRPFHILPAQDLSHILEQVQQGNVEVVTSLKETAERSRFLAFAPPYIQVPTVILVKSSNKPEPWPQGYLGKSVAVGKGYGVQGYLEQQFPAIQLTLVADDLEGMRQLSFGAVDAVIMDVASASYFIEREKFAMQLQQADFFDRLQQAMAAFPRLPAHSLQLEILETSALEDMDLVSRFIGQCGELGVGFALDDFGTGYSSLTYLKRLPITTVKIDQSFVRDMLLDRDHRSILDGILWIMRQLGRSVIAEGVETLEHGRTLMDLGCELAQGYGIARPMPVDQLPAWLARWQVDAEWQAVARVPRTAV